MPNRSTIVHALLPFHFAHLISFVNMGSFEFLAPAIFLVLLLSPPCSGEILCKSNEREALLEFKQGLTDSGGMLSSWTGKDCCRWSGVVCRNLTGNVINLTLSVNWSSGGEISPSLLRLEYLQHLELSWDAFHCITIPEFIGSFSKLRYLDLSGVNFGGPIPHQLGNLSTLQELRLYGGTDCQLTVDNGEWLSHLSSLQHLVMNSVNMEHATNVIQALNALPSLRTIALPFCSIQHIPLSLARVNFTSLTDLDLFGNQINSTIPQWLFNITSLQTLELGQNQFWGGVPVALGKLCKLQSLSLFGNELNIGNQINSTIPQWLFNITSLRFLDLSYNHFWGGVPVTLGNLCKLQDLSLSGNELNIGSSQLKFLTGCIKRSLQSLRLSYCKLTGYIPNWLAHFTNLQFLDLSGNSLYGSIPSFLGRLSSLEKLYLSSNKFSGEIPESLCALTSMENLVLDGNALNGSIPACLGRMDSCSWLSLAENNLTGTIPASIWQLPKLFLLDLSSNYLQDVLSESHFTKPTSLKVLYLSSNSLFLNLTMNWVPPFHLRELRIRSCRLWGDQFPLWLQTQDELSILDLSNAGISGHLPPWIWNFSSNIMLMNLSHNDLTGELQYSSKNGTDFLTSLDLSFNQFEGPLPHFYAPQLDTLVLSNNLFSGTLSEDIGLMMPNIAIMLFSMNNISGSLPHSLCNLSYLYILDLSSNHISGKIPKCFKRLSVLNLGNNSLTGGMPASPDSSCALEFFILRSNYLSGPLPLSLKTCVRMVVLDISENNFTGNIPAWLGDSMSSLKILSLRENIFEGYIPQNLANISSLQVIDLSRNSLFGTIPSNIGNISAMKYLHNINESLGGDDTVEPYKVSILMVTKHEQMSYNTLLVLVTSIDLSGNKLSSEMPKELGDLLGLKNLNLSTNLLNGGIPENIGKLRWLESIDLSRNMLSGHIPQSFVRMTSMSALDLSFNMLSGRIPVGRQFQTFTASSFTGNRDLCGYPLDNCEDTGGSPNHVIESINMAKEGEFESIWLYTGMEIGVVVGFWAFCGTLICWKRWRRTYFHSMDIAYAKLREMIV